MTGAAEKVEISTGATMAILAFVGVLLTIPAVLLFVATATYRSAVHTVHEETADSLNVDLAEIASVDGGVKNCWNEVGPASVWSISPAESYELADIALRIHDGLVERGFQIDGGSPATGHRWSRERQDSLDADMVVLTTDSDERHIEMVADVFDADMVLCPWF